MQIHYLNAKGKELFINNIIHLQNVDNYTWIATNIKGKELTIKTERIEGIADIEKNRTLKETEYKEQK